MILAQAFPRFAIDLDGVVWRGSEPIPGAPETIASLREAGRRVCFVTNNSSEPVEDVAARLKAMGAGGDAREVVTSAEATARLLERVVPGLRGRLTHVIGGQGLREAVGSTGARIASPEDAATATLVVVGLDRDLTYDALRAATLAISAGATFVASNGDASFPGPDGPWPGAGAIAAAISAATGVQPLIAGKPQPDLLGAASDRLGGEPVLFVGDRVDTDVAAAEALGWPSALVLTGVTSVIGLAAASVWPTYLLRDLTDLVADLPHPRIRAATGPDLPQVASLLHAGGLVSGAARERVGRTLVAEDDRNLMATAAFEVLGERGILRSVAVDQRRRNQGAGTLITAAALHRMRLAGVREAYLATDRAAGFFSSCGFEQVPKGTVPDDIAEHPHLVRECQGATVMRATI